MIIRGDWLWRMREAQWFIFILQILIFSYMLGAGLPWDRMGGAAIH